MTEPSGEGVGATQVSEAHTSGPVVITGLEGLEAHVGQKVGISDWKPVVQEDITTFAKLTGDEQWIHVDPERAASGPFGTTIAHGYLTLSLLPALVPQVLRVEGMKMGI